jgi:putative transposase
MRKSRQLQLADTGIFHKFFKGHNGEHIFASDAEKTEYLRCLCDSKNRHGIADHVLFYSYCIMSNHPHEIGKAGWDSGIKHCKEQGITALGNWMRNAHSRFGRWYNNTKQRFGKVSNERAKTTQMKSDIDTLKTMFYADANPVRAGLVTHPSKYRWSSYRFYAYGETNEFTDALNPPDAYLALGKTPRDRQRAYRSLMDAYLRRNQLLNDTPEEDNIDLSMYDTGSQCIIALLARAQNRAGPG